MDSAKGEEILEHDEILDITRSAGGVSGVYVISRLAEQPLLKTNNYVRLA